MVIIFLSSGAADLPVETWQPANQPISGHPTTPSLACGVSVRPNHGKSRPPCDLVPAAGATKNKKVEICHWTARRRRRFTVKKERYEAPSRISSWRRSRTHSCQRAYVGTCTRTLYSHRLVDGPQLSSPQSSGPRSSCPVQTAAFILWLVRRAKPLTVHHVCAP